MGDKIQLNIIGLTSGHSQRNSYTLILGEENGDLKLPIVIGHHEAQSIALVIEELKPQRPLTHDLMFDTLSQYGITLKEVIIDNLVEGVFFAKLITELDGVENKVDSRTSDAIALALRAKCPIYTYKTILDDAGVIYDNDEMIETEYDEPEHMHETDDSEPPSDELESMSLEDLNAELDKSIQVEDYDRAAIIRDEINTRS